MIIRCVQELKAVLKFTVQQFHNPLMYLLCASAVLMAITGDVVDGCIVAVVILLNVIIGAVQEYRLSRISVHLKATQHREYVVVRGEGKVIVDEQSLKVGDIIVLQDGQMIPADGRVLVAHDLLVNESMLTGESGPVSKQIVAEQELQAGRNHDKKGYVFAGTNLVTGYAHVEITALGNDTERSKLRRKANEHASELPLQKDLSALIRFILISIILICAGLFIIGLIDGKPISELLAALLALFMCAVPQGLPVIMTVILAVGSYRLSLHKVLVKRLQAVETLGRADLLVVDKTGTLTTNELVVCKIVAGSLQYTVTGSGYNAQGEVIELNKESFNTPTKEQFSNAKEYVGFGEPDQITEHSVVNLREHRNGNLTTFQNSPDLLRHVMQAASLLDSSHVFFDETEQRFVVKGNPNEAALGVCAKKFGMKTEQFETAFERVYEIPFHADTQMHIGYFKDRANNQGVIYCAGTLQALSKNPQAKKEFNEADLQAALAAGMRIVAIGYATCELSELNKIIQDQDQERLYFLDLFMRSYTIPGFFCVEDALKENVKATIEAVKASGISVVMATGDHASTALQVAQATGIASSEDKVFDVSMHTSQELQASIGKYNVYARCLPDEKATIVRAFQQQRHLAVMMGDGTNDVPAMVVADLAICMGRGGSDSAKEVANVVVLDDAFSAIAYSVSEGRHILYTFKRVVFYFLVANLSEVLVMVVAFMGYPIPLVASHILWLNLVTDGFLDATLSLEQQDADVVASSFKDQVKTLISPYMIAHVVILAVISAGITAQIFVRYLAWHDLQYARTMCVAGLTMCQVVNALNSRSLHKSLFNLPAAGNVWLYTAFAAIAGIFMSCMYIPTLQKMFSLQPLGLFDWLVIGGIATFLLCLEELRKFFLRFMTFWVR